MTIKELVNLSGILATCDCIDYAIPINPDHTYPFGGRAISVYDNEKRYYPRIVSYAELAKMALENGNNDPELIQLSHETNRKTNSNEIQ